MHLGGYTSPCKYHRKPPSCRLHDLWLGFEVLTPKQRCSVQPLTFSNFFWSSHPLLALPQPRKPKVCGMGSFCFWELLSVFPPAVILAKSFFQVSGWLFSSLWLFLDNLCPSSVFARAELLDHPCSDGKTERTVLHVAPSVLLCFGDFGVRVLNRARAAAQQRCWGRMPRLRGGQLQHPIASCQGGFEVGFIKCQACTEGKATRSRRVGMLEPPAPAGLGAEHGPGCRVLIALPGVAMPFCWPGSCSRTGPWDHRGTRATAGQEALQDKGHCRTVAATGP